MQTGIRNQYSKKLIMFNKIYKNDNKFGGIGNIFNFKVIIFLNKCKQVYILEDAYI